MKASLLLAGLAVAILSIAPANAETKPKLAKQAAAGPGCSVSGTWPNPTPVVCWPEGVKRFHNFNECRESFLKLGFDTAGISWFCTSQGYKT
ncbi:hypothetical protein [Bradyrhizobium sp. RD5-C2]|uniref:hypothetical protein n=1 Tax=Bradyrhizobium sp. RD5-C2 TaxID=244562 RepID=UPI001CC5B618|nr:hypothetical protein [Bradyrhizobium sp. RD5-C2]GIQ78164.1 hypothetical protein BraRD5C2_66140 [Bradyrhizobium sp. RD5-C2]